VILEGLQKMISLVDLRGGLIETVGCDVGVTKEDDLVRGSERQVDKETVGCDVAVTKEDYHIHQLDHLP
jgi:hypothetical protein